jgi:hypothetical protein
MSLIARVIGVFTSPRAIYADIAARPTLLGALILTLVCGSLPYVALSMTERGKEMTIDRTYEGMQAFERALGQPMPDRAYDEMEKSIRHPSALQIIGQFVGTAVVVPIILAIEAGLLFVIFTSIMGGDGRFKQVMAIVVFASLIVALGMIFSVPIMYAKRSYSSPTALNVFAPFLDPRSFLGSFLGWIDIFRLWWIVSLSIGLAVLYRKRTGPIAITLMVVYGVFAFAATAIGLAFSSGA